MSDAERKVCPHCGHPNRVPAKNCTQCGFAFFLATSGGVLRKRCHACGYMNRLGAKVCSQCGAAFGGKLLAPREQPQKWCPNCGARRRDGAKVCSFCGYRFKVPGEPPVVQAGTLSEPIAPGGVISAPKPPDLSGEPAPFLSEEELKRLRQVGEHRPGFFVRLYQVLRDDKR